MKKAALCLSLVVALNSFGQGYSSAEFQSLGEPRKRQVINMLPIEVAYDMTTHIIFPGEISYVDLGSNDIISEKAENIGNVLKVKAQKKVFTKTNMTVITSDGKYFAFMVYYAPSPKALNIKLSANDFSSVSPKVNPASYDGSASYAMFDDSKVNEAEMAKYGSEILKRKRRLFHIGQEKYDMQVNIQNIFIKDNVLFFDLHFSNRSSVPYDIDLVKFYVKDAEQMKKTAQQELETLPLSQFSPDRTQSVAGKSNSGMVYSFQRFTIPDKKVFAVEVFEKNGGRKFSFNLTNKDIIKAIKL